MYYVEERCNLRLLLSRIETSDLIVLVLNPYDAVIEVPVRETNI